jgi:tRNA (cytidine/uridine-2'-O-)-methyltransferase
MVIALYEPDIPQNTGTILRLGACLGVPVHVVGPAAFDSSERNFRRAGLDYLDHVSLVNHVSFATFDAWRRAESRRLILLSTTGDTAYADFAFRASDVLLCGRESAGVPESVHAAADARLCVPMQPGMRSLNVAVALAIVLGEALRQTGAFPR